MTALRKAWWALQVKRRAAKALALTGERRRKAEQVLAQRARPYKLHVGCGTVRFEGWINLDADTDVAKPDVVWDLRNGLPTPDASCQYIHSEHVVEHIPVAAGVRFFQECRRSLVPGGVMRVAMPSLDVILEQVCAGRWREQDWLTWPEFQHVSTRAEMMNMVFRAWEHEWIYDREELERRLKEAGFTEMRHLQWGESAELELRNRETRRDSLLIMEAVRTNA